MGEVSWRRALPLLVATIVITAMLLSPGGTVPSGFPHADKLTHALMFAVLAFASRWARISPALTVVWLALYGVATEILQATVAVRRSGSVWDWAADVLGIVIGVAVFAMYRNRARSRRARSAAGWPFSG